MGVIDAWGNHSPQLPAQYGQQCSVVRNTSGDALVLSGQSTSPQEIEVLNRLPKGAVQAVAFRDGRPIARTTAIAPGQKAVFSFRPTIFIGVVSQIQEGQSLSSAVVSAINTEIDLLGIASADIVMTGGGPGAQALPFQFTLANVVMA